MASPLQRAYELARSKHGCKNWSAFAALLGESPNTLTNWKARGIPRRAILHIAMVVGTTPAYLAGEIAEDYSMRGGELDEGDLTPDEQALIAHYRAADEKARRALFDLIAGLDSRKPQGQPGKNVSAIRRRPDKPPTPAK